MRHPVRAVVWSLVYVLLAIAPLPLSLVNLDPGRGFWVNLSVALGFVGLSLMGLQFVLAARFVRATTTFGIDVVLQVHRQMTWIITLCVLAHPIVLFVWDSRFLSLLDVVHAPWRAKFAVLSVVLLLVLIATSVWRRRIRLSYQAWQVLHAALATGIVIAALVHVLMIGYYVDQPWERGLWIAYSAAFVGIGAWVRVIKPVLRWRRRWEVVSVREQPGPGHTIRMRPLHSNGKHNKGFRFEPGQFAWINVGRSPFSIEYHPFSISSSAEQHEYLEFTIKTEANFTQRVHWFTPGETVYLDGPWGHFTMQRHEGPGFVFIGGGVGITPLLSMLSTLADRGDRRPCWAVVGNRYEHQMIGRDELEELAQRMELTVVQTLSAPDGSWTGRKGRIDATLLDDVLPADRHRLQYFLCGSNAMMDGAEAALDQLGVPRSQVHSERFAMA
ncbi:oxidoreductase [Nakamurella sp. YIM 132087]|uniref:Oxidoreductase n=1 Tax=Nakamurella alba TaxID=2665158 RepID=A0A7K1FPH9_9ACTN|nr:ferric reductase-like transmembrane domain-containing protein [Nakamurella alba]MTD15249.1 oxidoreductase [Nakamurella alba]